MSKSVLEQTMEKANGYVQAYNEALLAKNLSAKAEAEENLKGALKEYKKQKLDSVLYHLKQEENPVMAAVRQLTYPVMRSKIVREEGIETGIELVETNVRIPLVKVCEYCGLSTVWQYKVEKLALLLSLRAAKELKIPAAEMKRMTKDFRMNELARKVELGETPESNTQIVAMIQNIMDDLLPGAGKANSHDAAYAWMTCTRAGREAKTVKVCDPRTAHNIMIDVMNRIVTKGRYEVDYRKVKDSKAEAPKADESKASESEAA